MEEREFIELADVELARIESALEAELQRGDADWDFEIKPGGIVELDFADASKIVINRHAAAREIWVAAKSGGFHFKPPASGSAFWQDTRRGESLRVVLERCIGAQSGEATHLEM